MGVMRLSLLLVLTPLVSWQGAIGQSTAGSCHLFDMQRTFSPICSPDQFEEDSSQDAFHNENHDSAAWIKAGVGNCFFGLTSGVSFAYSFGNNIFSLRFISANEFVFNVEGIYDEPLLSYQELGITYGRAYREKNVVWSCAAGLGFVSGANRGRLEKDRTYERIQLSGLCIPFEAGFRIELWHLGIGGSLFGSINSERTFCGWMLEIYVGVFSL
jgi:hypothetical protein